MTERQIFGLSAALVTPFTVEGPPDLRRLVRHAHWVLANGCDSLTLFGTTGEGFSIGIAERAEMLGAVAGGGVDLRTQLYAGVTASAIADAVEQARLSLDAGSRGLLVAPPHFFKAPDEEGLYGWFSRVFEAIGPTLRNVILYNIPGQTAVPIPRGLVGRLRNAFPDAIAGVKDSSGDPASTDAYLDAHGDLAILVGDERQLPRAMARGAQGSICGIANFAPELLRPVIHGGRDDPRLKPLVDEIVANPILPAIKALVAHRHGDPVYARTRPPLVDLDASRAAGLIATFDGLMAEAGAG